ncbi:hypothetical protein BX600DRAFT_484096 [Xylariales sp. PMI_506]|nr:hypothetical protein BX600DRAFT_484096 [Xylariales sp. PMI_506]
MLALFASVALFTWGGLSSTVTSPYGHLPRCKIAPDDPSWPASSEWGALNSSIAGSLIATQPVASVYYPSESAESSEACSNVIDNWGYSALHASFPESIDYPTWANNSCLPPNAKGYNDTVGCHIGAYPQYIVNATTAEQISTALRWASDRNIRVIVKGTGHDLNERLEVDDSWTIPYENNTARVLIAGSGNNWGQALGYALNNGRAVVSGVDATVGMGGYIQGGGHGPLSSTYGLSADQILQVTIVTALGEILIANDSQNQDLFWAIRGGAYVMLTYPAPTEIVEASVAISAANMSDFSNATVNATWVALSTILASFPDLMDQGITGSGSTAVGGSAERIFGLTASPPGVVASFSLWAYNSTVGAYRNRIETLNSTIMDNLGEDATRISLTIGELSVTSNYSTFFASMNSSPSTAGAISLSSSRLLGREEVTEIALEELSGYLQRVMRSQISDVPEPRRGALNPVWRKTYVHAVVTGTNVNLDGYTPAAALQNAAEWAEDNKETHDFYGTSYDNLVQIKRKHDPSSTLSVVAGVDSNFWNYDLNTGEIVPCWLKLWT